MEEYTECKLCQLQFQSELELEEHLFSVLHHRTFDKHNRNCRHECNLCGIKLMNLFNYIQHLKTEAHKRKYFSRKAAIDDGTYTKPEIDLSEYVSTFMISPKSENQGKAPSVSADNRFESLQSTLHPMNGDYPQWDGKSWPAKMENHQDTRGLNADYSGLNPIWFGPYEGDWIIQSRQTNQTKHGYIWQQNKWATDHRRVDYDSFNWRKNPPEPKILKNKAKTKIQTQNRVQSSTNNNTRTMQLVDRAHQVMGNRAAGKQVPELNNKLVLSEASSVTSSTDKATKTNLVKRKNSHSLHPTALSNTQEKKRSSRHYNNRLRHSRSKSLKNSLGVNKTGFKQLCDTSVSSTTSRHSRSFSSSSACQTELDTSSHPSFRSNSDHVIPRRSSLLPTPNTAPGNCQPLLSTPRMRCQQQKPVEGTRMPEKSTEQNKRKSNDTNAGLPTPNMYDEFRNQIDIDLALNPKKLSEDLSGAYSCSIDGLEQSDHDASTLKDGRKENHLDPSMQRRQKSEVAPSTSDRPRSTENIRLEFRKILDEIDQPIVSASESEDGAGCRMKSMGSNITGSSVSRAESYPPSVCSSSCAQFSETGDISQTSNHLNSLMNVANSSKNHNTLPSNDSGNGNISTPRCVQKTCNGDIDTPTSKKRTNPQPNIAKARSRLSSRHKEIVSPETATESKNAKLRKLLLKYDRAKKNGSGSPETEATRNNQKRTPGPRFGIDLHLINCNSAENVEDIQSLTMHGELEEILPGRRNRSMSENDTSQSFTTAATEESTTETIEKFPMATEKPKQDKPRHSAEVEIKRTQPLNSRLLQMSEREEVLHATVRSLDIQDANIQVELENALRAMDDLQKSIHALKSRKAHVLSAKVANETELSALRQERLMLLRCSLGDTGRPEAAPHTVFQDVTPNSRLCSPSFEATVNTQSTPTPTNPVHRNGGPVCFLGNHTHQQPPPFLSSFSNIASPEISSTVPDTTQKIIGQDKTAPTDSTETPDVAKEATPMGFSGQASCGNDHVTTSHNYHSGVKTEPGVGNSSNAGFPQASEVRISAPILAPAKVKLECDGQNTRSDELLPGEGPPVDEVRHPVSESSSFNDMQYQTIGNKSDTQVETSSEFYSFINGDKSMVKDSASEVDRIVSKYIPLQTMTEVTTLQESESVVETSNNPKTSTPENKSKSQKKKLRSPNLNLRRSPRFHQDQQRKKSSQDSANYVCTPPAARSEGLPSEFKAHQSPLVGMKLTSLGLVTCSLDDTVVLHDSNTGQKSVLNLDATPTAVAAFENRGTIVCVSLQKIISYNSDASVVVNKVEHSLHVYALNNHKTNGGNVAFDLLDRLRMKTRVLCMHFDNDTLFCGMRNGMVAIVPLTETNQVIEEVDVLECHYCSAVTCLTTGTEGVRRILCCGSTDCTVSVRDASDGLLLRTIQGHTKTVTCLQLMHHELFSAGVDRQVLGHNLDTGQLLHRFVGHPGVVRSLCVVGSCMITLCSDRNIRFFNTKTCRLIEKPKATESLPLFVCVKPSKDKYANNTHVAYVGCENGTILQKIPFPSEDRRPSSDSSLTRTPKQKTTDDSPTELINLTGDYECLWSSCDSAGIFASKEDLCKHVLAKHVNARELTVFGLDTTSDTLSVGTCCQWEKCTHYFAPELDTIVDVHNHVKRHFQGKQT